MKAHLKVCSVWLAVLLSLAVAVAAWAEDVVELMNGGKVRGKVLRIDKEQKQFEFETQLGPKTIKRTYSYDKVHAVTIDGKRHVLSPREGAGGSAASISREEIDRLIDDAGKQPPDWFETEPLNYPKTLDLGWPLKPADNAWNNQKNVGQYIWDVINPNPGRWRSGVKLVHHIMATHKGQPALLRRDMETLGTMYFELFQDYPRAAFWLRRAAVQKGSLTGVLLAECYWRMGNKKMALEMLTSKALHGQAIKLLGDMGETDRALQLAEALILKRKSADALLLAGDACRTAERYDDAIQYYEKAITASQAADENEEHRRRYAARARESIDAIRLFEQADPQMLADGSYNGTSTGYNGAVDVQVKIASGRIESVEVVRHEEKQFYSAIDDTTRQILKKQSVKSVDATSRATITSQAIVNAAARALASGSQK